jgi:hypothetical protein
MCKIQKKEIKAGHRKRKQKKQKSANGFSNLMFSFASFVVEKERQTKEH